ncbi:MAG: protein-glutamate O-methyltransferase CheR [Acetobacteraceae bacterium]|nr:protein-glutamate O-methyltransferase CheR [Acetobacteraceae bacterium]
MTPRSFDIFAAVLQRGSGLVIGPEKQYLLETRLGGIMQRQGIADLDGMAARLQAPGSAELTRQVIEAMTTNESFFFRDERPFVHFRTFALPRLHASRPAGAKLRIWSAASSSGQEAYSLAMIVADMRHALAGRQVEILGTDLSREQVLRAQEGLYSQFEVQRGLPMQNLVKHFRKDGPNWRLNDAIRAMVSFREWNLLADPRPLGQFDVVFCRNVLIYFDRPTKTRVLDSIARQMPADGLLYLGGAETVLGITDCFDIVADNRGVYEVARAPARPVLAAAGR